MHARKTLLAAISCCLLYSCSQSNRTTSRADENESTDAVAVTAGNEKTAAVSGQPAASQPYESPDRKVVRTADFRCRVKDVFAAATHIENTVKALGGAVADSRIEAEPGSAQTLPYSNDSLRQLQSYTSTAHLTLRIPVQSLDSVLNDIAAQDAFINLRHLQLSDVTLRYLGNELRNRTAQASGAGKNDNINLNATLIDRKLDNLELMDNVHYATFTLALYQPERIDAIMIANTNAVMQPAAGQRLKTALHGGLAMLQELALLLIYLWPVLLGGTAVLVYIKRRKARRLTAAPVK